MDQCLSHDLIACYVRQSCSASVVQSVETHAAGCERCRRQIELARSGISEGAGESVDRGSAASQTVEAPPMFGSDAQPTLTMPQPSAPSSNGPDSPLNLGVTFEGYQLLEELPQGGQAVVYKALHKATKAKVALKVLLPGLAGKEEARQKFKQEVELAASLDHPNIVRIRDSGVSQGQYYFSMDYIRGQPLDRYVQSKVLSLREKMVLFSKICDAIAHAHRCCVIHRDLKPSNILVDTQGEPHILDFGLAKTAMSLNASADPSVMPTQTGDIKGTVAYMSPEQAAGRPDLTDVRTDVYSLGVILYQMCTGRLPYDVLGTIFDALRNIQYTEPVRPRQTISRFDSDVEAIILKSMAKDRDQRYQSTSALKEDVQRWLDGLPIIAKSISSIYVLRKMVAKHRYTATVIASMLVILCSSAFVSFYMYRGAHQARLEAQKTAEQALRMAQQQSTIAEGAARFISDLMAERMMYERLLTGAPPLPAELYGPRRVNSAFLRKLAARSAWSNRHADPNTSLSQAPQDGR